ncbi:MAG: FliA/WhiG family RNA polymerase sigma factor [Actinobacteria bacterium]|nr:FliA/WhiG family RNA polymerase sigma factor [Actinomycetota bacterium]
MDAEVRELWERYRSDGDAAAREDLILTYSPLVKYVAGRVSVSLPDTIEHSDLVSYGMFGLMDAIERFDTNAGVKFSTYAITRIRGSIIDELRKVDWVPRSVRNKAKRIARAVRRLEHDLGRTPTDEEIAAELEITVDDLHAMLEQTAFTTVAELDRTLSSDGDDSITLADTLQDTIHAKPQDTVDDQETRRLLVEEIEELPEREQKIIALYYFEGMTLAQIGGILGVTESRVCQIHSKVMVSLRNRLTDKLAS